MNPSDKVVCIDDGPCRCDHPMCDRGCSVTKGNVYVVENAHQFQLRGRERTALILVGVPARLNHKRGTNSERFRLLSDIKSTAEPIMAHNKA